MAENDRREQRYRKEQVLHKDEINLALIFLFLCLKTNKKKIKILENLLGSNCFFCFCFFKKVIRSNSLGGSCTTGIS
uniref:Uncharacterized protein n=1 Tax=Anguilla anguilla TaxID=7936 RepID=A0A0E9X655_ANGAN